MGVLSHLLPWCEALLSPGLKEGVAVARQGVPYKSSPRDSPICHPFLFVHLGWKYWRGYHIFQYLHTTLKSASLIFCQNVAEFLLPVWLGGSGTSGRFSRSKVFMANPSPVPTCPSQAAVLVRASASQTLPGWFGLVVYLFVLFLLLTKIRTGNQCQNYHREASRWQRIVITGGDDLKVTAGTGKGRRLRTSAVRVDLVKIQFQTYVWQCH